MRFLLLAGLVAMAADASPPAEFEQVYGGAEVDRGVLARPTRDGGYIAVGITTSFGEGGEDVYLVKTDAAGEPEWSQTYGGPGEDNGWSVLETDDGFAVAGFTKSFGSGGFDFYLIKTDVDGKVEWSRTYGGEGDDRCWALEMTDDGGFVLVGETTSSGAGERDCLLIGVDSSGTELWSETYGGESGDRCFAVARADDGGYMLAGQTYSEGAGDRDAYVIKTEADGKLEWSKTFGGADSDVGHSVTRTTDDRFVVTGYTTSFATAGDDPYLIKLDVRGGVEWTRVLAIDGVHHTLTGDEAADGGYFLVGFSDHPGSGARSALVVRTEPDGQLRWHRNILPASSGQSFGYTVQATPDGGCVFAGHTNTMGAGDLDLLLVKVADEAPPGTAVLDSLVGAWTMVGQLQGEDVEYVLDVEWTLGGAFLLLHMVNVADPSEYEASIYIGPDETGTGLVAHWLDIFGASSSKTLGTGTASDHRLELTFDYSSAPFRDTVYLDPATKRWRFLIEAQSEDGAWRTYADYTLAPR